MAETSVIIPAYNVSNYLEKCVNSVLDQTMGDLEVILVNDGSTDRTPEICEQMREKDSRVRVIHKENGGLSSARNSGLQAASGEYVFFLDGDDWIPEHCLSDLHQLRQKTDADIAIGNYGRFEEKKGVFSFYATRDNYFEKTYTPREMFAQADDTKDNHRMIFIVAWGKLYRRELFKHILYPEGVVAEDDYTTWKLYLLADKIAFLNKTEYIYRINESGITAKYSWDKIYPLKSVQQRIAVLSMLDFDISRELMSYKWRMSGQEKTLLESGTKNLEAYQEVRWMKQVLSKYGKE